MLSEKDRQAIVKCAKKFNVAMTIYGSVIDRIAAEHENIVKILNELR